LLRPITGWEIEGAELHEIARGIVGMKHEFNLREGWTREEDTLPARLLDDPITLPSGREASLSRVRLEAMVNSYHRARGLERSENDVDEAVLPWR